MLLLVILWLGLPRTFGDEAFFIKWTSIIKKSVLGIDRKPDPERVLYVDVSTNRNLVEITDPFYEEITGYNHAVITDRADLARFLELVSYYGEGIPLVLLDIGFERSCPDDVFLQSVIDSLPFPVLGGRRLEKDGRPAPSVIELPTGVAGYLTIDNTFMKYPLFLSDTLPSLPLRAWSVVTGRPFSSHPLLPRLGNRRSLASPVIDFKIRPLDLNYGTTARTDGYTIRQMGTLLFEWDFWEADDIRALLRDKLIVVGDFKFDVHGTVFGDMAGPLIVHNAYLTLMAGESIVPWEWVLLLFTLFWWMSWRAYHEARQPQKDKDMDFRSVVGRVLVESIDETFFLALGTVLSYFLFNIHVNILILLIYLKVVTYLLRRFVLWRRARARRRARAEEATA